MNKKKRKGTFKAIAACAVSAVMLLAGGCGKPQGQQQGPPADGGGAKIAVITKQQLSFWDDVKNGAEDACNEFGYEMLYTVADGDNDYVSQVAAINDAINKKAVAIVIAPNSTTELNDALNKAIDQGIKVVTINSSLDSSMTEAIVSCVKSSDSDGGAVAAKNAIKAYTSKGNSLENIGKVAIVGHTATTAEERISGFIDRLTQGIADAKGVEVPQANPYAAMMGGGDAAAYGAEGGDADAAAAGGADAAMAGAGEEELDDAAKAAKEAEEENSRQLDLIKKSFVQGERCAKRDEAAEEAKKLLGKDGNGISIIYGTNTNTTLGICDAVESLGLTGKVVVVGFNSDEDELAYIRRGVLDGVIVQNPYIMGYVGIRYAKQSVSGTLTPHELDTGVTFVSAGNLNDDYIQLLLYPDKY